MKTENKNENKRLILKGVLLGLVLIIAFIIAYLARLYYLSNDTLTSSYKPKVHTTISKNQSVSILLLGVDQGLENRHDQGNSDTMLVLTLNPKTDKAKLISIPRDTLAEIDAKKMPSYYDKINAAYQVGGVQASADTVSNLLNIPIDYAAEFDMKGLYKLVDSVGGIDVDVPFNFSYDWCSFRKGKQHINGRHALAYARMRYDDPEGDYGRQKRQRQVIEAIAKKCLTFKTLSHAKPVLKTFTTYAHTNLTTNDLISLAINHRGCMNHLYAGTLKGHDAWTDGRSIQVPSNKELQKTSDMLRESMDLPKEKLSNAETRLNSDQTGLDWSNPNAFDNYKVYNSDL